MNKKILFTILIVVSLFQNLKAQNATEAPKPTTPPTSYMPKVAGFINVRHQYSTELNSFASGKNGFDLRRAFLILSGNISKNINYFVLGDLAGTPKLIDAFAEWKPLSYLSLQAGQFKTPITLENPYIPANLETVDNSQVIDALVNNIETYKNIGRDLGVSINGSAFQMKGFNLLDYRIAILNGNAINLADNNKTKDIAASVYVHPLKALTVGASIYKGKFGTEATKYTRDRYSVGAKYDDGKILFRTEYISGKTAALNSDGFYASAAYYVTPKIQPVLKYDAYTSNTANESTNITNLTAGINYWITAKSRVQFNYTHKNYADVAKTDVDYFVTQLLVAF